MKKRLIGILVVIGILTVFGAYYLMNKTSYNITNQFGIQGRVVDYGTYSDDGNYNEIMDKMEKEYLENTDKTEKVYLIYGNSNGVSVTSYEEILKGEVNVLVGTKNGKLPLIKDELVIEKLVPRGNKVEVYLNEKPYDFDLKEGENVYFIVHEEND